MADNILTTKQLEDFFQSLTMIILGIPSVDPGTQKPINQDRVRIDWPTGGAPAWKISEDIVFLQVTTAGDPYIQQRNVSYQQNADELNRKVSYTRVHSVQWIVYGPNSTENAESIRNGIYLPDSKVSLGAKKLYLVTDVDPVTRLPELFNGQWWQRADVSARFNELVTRSAAVPSILGTQIVIKSDTGQEREVN